MGKTGHENNNVLAVFTVKGGRCCEIKYDVELASNKAVTLICAPAGRLSTSVSPRWRTKGGKFSVIFVFKCESDMIATVISKDRRR